MPFQYQFAGHSHQPARNPALFVLIWRNRIFSRDVAGRRYAEPSAIKRLETYVSDSGLVTQASPRDYFNARVDYVAISVDAAFLPVPRINQVAELLTSSYDVIPDLIGID
ncbi:hypothetical protein HB4184_03330 [Pseudomonas putida]|nr:hypothetical protein HB4184_03330 [Pseudomonas putida]